MLPAVRAALICQSVLTETDGVHSAIRIIHRLNLAPGEHFDATVLLMLANRAPAEIAEHVVVVFFEHADGRTLGNLRIPVRSPLEVGAAFSVIVPFRFQSPPAEGLYWLRFAFDADEAVLTRVPVEFRHLPPDVDADR